MIFNLNPGDMKYYLTHRGFVISFGWSYFRITISTIYFLGKRFASYQRIEACGCKKKRKKDAYKTFPYFL